MEERVTFYGPVRLRFTTLWYTTKQHLWSGSSESAAPAQWFRQQVLGWYGSLHLKMKSLEQVCTFLKIYRNYKVKAASNLILLIIVCYLFVSQTYESEDQSNLIETPQSLPDDEKVRFC